MSYQNDRIKAIPAPLPKDYDRQANFTDYEAANPGKPAPGASLDAEFNAIEQALDETQARQRLIQRDDGAIANKSVGLDQLKQEARVGVNPPSIWGPSIPYGVNDSAIESAGVWYVAKIAHVSSTDFAADLAAGYWEELIDLSGLQDASLATLSIVAVGTGHLPVPDEETLNRTVTRVAYQAPAKLAVGPTLVAGSNVVALSAFTGYAVDPDRRGFVLKLLRGGTAITATDWSWTPGQASLTIEALAGDVPMAVEYDLGHDLEHMRTRRARSIDEMLAWGETVETIAITDGYAVPGDGGGGTYRLDPDDTTSAHDHVVTLVAPNGGRWKLQHNGTVNLRQAGARANGVNHVLAIQRAINACYDNGLQLYVPAGTYTHDGLIVIPENFTMFGDGPFRSVFYNDYSVGGKRGVIVGTYGPANSQTPATTTKYPISSLTTKSVYIADTSRFQPGDVISIEGATPLRADTTVGKPNMLNEVQTVYAGRLDLRHNLDDGIYTGGAVYRLHDPLNEPFHTLDATGREWPLFVSTNTVIRDVGFRTRKDSGWPAVNLSSYKTIFMRVMFEGSGGAVGGNPVALCDFIDCHFRFGISAWEFAYLSHDTNIINPRAERIYDDTSTYLKYVGWTNDPEGAKRINITGGLIDNGNPTNNNYITIITGPESKLRDVTIFTNGQGVYGHHDASIEGCTVYWGYQTGISGFSRGVIANNRVVSLATTEANDWAIQTRSTECVVHGNNLLHVTGERLPQDSIDNLGNYAPRFGNHTYHSLIGNRHLNYVSDSESEVAPAGEVTLSDLIFAAGTFTGGDGFKFESMFNGPAGSQFTLRMNGINVRSVSLAAEADTFVEGRVLAGGGLGDTNYRISLRLVQHGGTGVDASLGMEHVVKWHELTSVTLVVTSMPATQNVRHFYTLIEKDADRVW